MITTLALIGGTTLAFWSLTEDNAVLAIPVLQLAGPFLLKKIQEKSWLDAKQVHLGNELLTTAILGKKNACKKIKKSISLVNDRVPT